MAGHKALAAAAMAIATLGHLVAMAAAGIATDFSQCVAGCPKVRELLPSSLLEMPNMQDVMRTVCADEKAFECVYKDVCGGLLETAKSMSANVPGDMAAMHEACKTAATGSNLGQVGQANDGLDDDNADAVVNGQEEDEKEDPPAPAKQAGSVAMQPRDPEADLAPVHAKPHAEMAERVPEEDSRRATRAEEDENVKEAQRGVGKLDFVLAMDAVAKAEKWVEEAENQSANQSAEEAECTSQAENQSANQEADMHQTPLVHHLLNSALNFLRGIRDFKYTGNNKFEIGFGQTSSAKLNGHVSFNVEKEDWADFVSFLGTFLKSKLELAKEHLDSARKDLEHAELGVDAQAAELFDPAQDSEVEARQNVTEQRAKEAREKANALFAASQKLNMSLKDKVRQFLDSAVANANRAIGFAKEAILGLHHMKSAREALVRTRRMGMHSNLTEAMHDDESHHSFDDSSSSSTSQDQPISEHSEHWGETGVSLMEVRPDGTMVLAKAQPHSEDLRSCEGDECEMSSPGAEDAAGGVATAALEGKAKGAEPHRARRQKLGV